METRYIEISLDTAKRWYEQGGELKDMALGAYSEQELIGSRLPKTWQEFCEQNEVKIGECYLDDCCGLIEADDDGNTRDKVNDRNILPSKQAAKQHLALMQLHQLRDAWREGWLPDWKDDNQRKYVVYNPEGEFTIGYFTITRRFLSFQDEKRAEEFKKCFIDLIKQAGDLI